MASKPAQSGRALAIVQWQRPGPSSGLRSGPMGRLTLPLTIPRLVGSGPGSSPSGACDVLLGDVRQRMLHGVCDSVL